MHGGFTMSFLYFFIIEKINLLLLEWFLLTGSKSNLVGTLEEKIIRKHFFFFDTVNPKLVLELNEIFKILYFKMFFLHV